MIGTPGFYIVGVLVGVWITVLINNVADFGGQFTIVLLGTTVVIEAVRRLIPGTQQPTIFPNFYRRQK